MNAGMRENGRVPAWHSQAETALAGNHRHQEQTMTRVVGIAGSLRTGSYNAALLRAASGLMPLGASLEIASIKGIPLYDGDVETNHGIPQAVTALKEQVAASRGLLLATPEYNNSIPGVFKNAIDWLSRPPADIPRVFGGRPVAIIGASPGGFGTILAQNAWLPVIRTLGMQPWFGKRLMVSRAGKAFNEAGELIDDQVRDQLQQFLHGFVEFIRRDDS
jgi:NAD(P)H-dependent FMN reductase